VLASLVNDIHVIFVFVFLAEPTDLVLLAAECSSDLALPVGST
jgi:hypothetical protein